MEYIWPSLPLRRFWPAIAPRNNRSSPDGRGEGRPYSPPRHATDPLRQVISRNRRVERGTELDVAGAYNAVLNRAETQKAPA